MKIEIKYMNKFIEGDYRCDAKVDGISYGIASAIPIERDLFEDIAKISIGRYLKEKTNKPCEK